MKFIEGTYRHYKGHIYRVLGEAQHTETGERLVAYRALQDNGTVIWVRPYTMFFDTVTVDGVKQPRFERIGDET
ncbi:MAG: DUF1653 domain-containing protein [Candidatus Saccharimonas sp.]